MGYQGNKSGFDGIPVGTIRSTFSHIPADRWCKTFGHKWRGTEGEEYCITCFIDKKEANGKEKGS
jgi:hypothetical protein